MTPIPLHQDTYLRLQKQHSVRFGLPLSREAKEEPSAEGEPASSPVRPIRVYDHLSTHLPTRQERMPAPSAVEVSHTVQSLTFGGNALMNKFLLFGLGGVGVNLDPLAGKTFVVSRFHQAPHHYLKVVHTKLPSKARVYQQTHQWSARNVARHAVPQAKFSYDLSPVEVVISYSPRRWYDYITSVFAIIGGAFTFMSMTSSLLNVASAHFKASIHKLS
eukprot:g28352.t1